MNKRISSKNREELIAILKLMARGGCPSKNHAEAQTRLYYLLHGWFNELIGELIKE